MKNTHTLRVNKLERFQKIWRVPLEPFQLATVALSLALIIGCSNGNKNSSADTSPSPTQASTKGHQTEVIKNVKLTCTTINFRPGGLESAGGEKVLMLSTADENRTEIISKNSWVEISVRSHHGQIQLASRDVEFDYLRGRVEFPLMGTPAVALKPNNVVGNHGFSWAHCETILKPAPEPGQSVKWSCLVDGYKDRVGKKVTIRKEVELKAEDNNLETVLFENKELILTASSFHGKLTVMSRNRNSKDGFENSTWTTTSAFNAESITLSEPHSIVTGDSNLQTEDELFPATVKCTRLMAEDQKASK